MPVASSLIHVSLLGLAIALPVLLGQFNSVAVGVTLDHYAEKPWPVLIEVFPWLPMPANTLVNIGYIITGLIWLRRTNKNGVTYRMSDKDSYPFYVFAWMAVLYGAVQAARILTLNQALAILDQWYTLPIFSWVIVWCFHIAYGWSSMRTLAIILLSSVSYCLALVFQFGFDIALGIHIALTVTVATCIYRRYPSAGSLRAYVQCCLCCIGFVCLKLLDHHLPDVHPVFSYFSGHFWSKICDFLQFHYASLFFLHLFRQAKKTA